MAVARLGGVDLFYEVRGEGRPVVLIAGYTCDHLFWSRIVPALAHKSQVVVFDNRGVGRTKDDGTPLTVELMAGDAAALIEHLKLSRPVVVGQSMGGAIVQTMLARFPHVCGPCVILNSAAAFRTAPMKGLNSLLELRKAGVDLDLLIEASLPWVQGSEWLSNPENIAAFKAAIQYNPFPQSVSDQERQLRAVQQFDARSINQPWPLPATVVTATEDILVMPSEGKTLAEQLGATFIEIPGGHGSPIEQPERVSHILTEVLGE
jgi:3-oxoadipate enol-lactonase